MRKASTPSARASTPTAGPEQIRRFALARPARRSLRQDRQDSEGLRAIAEALGHVAKTGGVITRRSCIGWTANCASPGSAATPTAELFSGALSKSPARSRRNPGKCAPRRASPGCAAIKAGARKPATSSRPSTAGSPRASTARPQRGQGPARRTRVMRALAISPLGKARSMRTIGPSSPTISGPICAQRERGTATPTRAPPSASRAIHDAYGRLRRRSRRSCAAWNNARQASGSTPLRQNTVADDRRRLESRGRQNSSPRNRLP